VLDIAERALALLDGDGLVSVRDGTITVVALHEGRAGRAEGDDPARVVKQAQLRARQPRAWPVRSLPPAHVGESITGDDIHEAIATSWGTRTYEAHPKEVRSRHPTVVVCRDLTSLGGGCVLGPEAAGVVLAALAPAFGVELALGADPPVASGAVTLVDDATGVRAFDAEGVPRQRVVLIDEGRFVSGVHDSQSGPTTGHASRALTLAPLPEHLRLQPTDADVGAPDFDEIAPLRAEQAKAVLARVEAVGADGSVRLG
jgi:hypothetical protein